MKPKKGRPTGRGQQLRAVEVKPASARESAIAAAKLPEWARLGSPEEIQRSLAMSILGVGRAGLGRVFGDGWGQVLGARSPAIVALSALSVLRKSFRDTLMSCP